MGTVENNTVAGNSAAQYGGGLHTSRGTITNCIIWGNTALTSAQLYNSSDPTYSCIQYWDKVGNGNIAEDPKLVDMDGPDNNPSTFADNDCRLSPDSPCIDAGKNEDWMWSAVDMDGNPRIFNETVDMGAYEYLPLALAVRVTEVLKMSSGDLKLVWKSRYPDTYAIWSSFSVEAGSWDNEAVIQSQGRSTTWTDLKAGGCSRKFYRIEIQK